jgi:hypothetical protein
VEENEGRSEAAIPSQREIDHIASFVEAARELKKEPFFHADEKRSFSFQGNNYTFEVGDRFHFRSALVTFRRIWMPGESSNFYDCYNILWRFAPTKESPLLQSWREQVSQIAKGPAFVGLPPQAEEKLTADELIDLWINAVFAHVSLKKEVDKRHKFETYLRKYGQAFMEFAFRGAVWQMGLQYQNVHNHGADQFLRHWESEAGIKPSFQIGAPFGEQIREVTPHGHILIRKSSSRFYNEETVERMFERIISRSRYRYIKSILDNLEYSASQKAKATIWAGTVEELLQKAGKELHMEALDLTDHIPHRAGLRSFVAVFDPETKSRSALMFDETRLITDATGLKMLAAELKTLQRELRDAANE